MMDERRKYIRIPEKSEISYHIVPTKTIGQYTTSNISQGGIRFFVHQFIPKDSCLKVRMNLGSAGTAIEALVQVVWVEESPHRGSYETGVRFIDIPQEAVGHLINYIKSFINKRSGPGSD